MTQAFVPLLPGAARGTEPSMPVRLKPVSSPAATFEPASALASSKTESHKDHTHSEPKITLERQGETITHIRIECGCGQVTELKCEY